MLHCHRQNDSCTKTGNDERQFNVSFIVSVKATGQCSQTTASEDRGEPKRNRTYVLLLQQPNALPLGQAGSLPSREHLYCWCIFLSNGRPEQCESKAKTNRTTAKTTKTKQNKNKSKTTTTTALKNKNKNTITTTTTKPRHRSFFATTTELKQEITQATVH